jgi:hypothetical protein
MSWLKTIVELIAVLIPPLRKAFEEPSPAEVERERDEAVRDALDAADRKPSRPGAPGPNMPDDPYEDLD